MCQNSKLFLARSMLLLEEQSYTGDGPMTAYRKRKKNEEKHLEESWPLEEIKEDGGVRAWLELTPWVTGGTRKKAERDFSAYLGSMNGRWIVHNWLSNERSWPSERVPGSALIYYPSSGAEKKAKAKRRSPKMSYSWGGNYLLLRLEVSTRPSVTTFS